MKLDVINNDNRKESLYQKIKNYRVKQVLKIPMSLEDEKNFNYIRKKSGFQEFPTYALSNNKVYTVVRVHTYKEELDEMWLTRFAHIENLVIELDIVAEETQVIKKTINRNVGVEHYKQENARSFSDAQDAYDAKMENKELYNEIKRGQGLNKLSLNFILWESSVSELEKKVKDLQEEMHKFDIEGGIFMHSIAEDLKVTKYKNATATISPAAATRTFMPFNFQEIIDPKGTYIGHSKNGGQLIIDHLIKSPEESRLTSDILITGKAGSGKSSFTKNVVKKEFLLGHHSIIIDPENEYGTLINELGGKIIDMSEGSIINPLEYKTEIKRIKNKKGEEEETIVGFETHISNLMLFFGILEPELASIDKGRLKEVMKDYYEYFFQTDDIYGYDTSNLMSIEYPIMSDFALFAIKKFRANLKSETLRDEEHKSYTLMTQVIQKITKDYSQYFVGHSSTDDIINEKLISFNFKKLDDMEEEIKNAIVFNVLNVFCNKKIIQNKEYNEKIIEKLRAEHGDGWLDKFFELRRMLRINVDEAHKYLNDLNPMFVEWFKNAVKRFRKYHACSLLSSQSLLDFKPINISSSVENNLTLIWKEIQYKYFFSQDIPKVGKEYENVASLLKYEDIDNITSLSLGEFLLKMPKRAIIGKHFIDSYEQSKLYFT